ncbi:MAG: hypothetical protein GY753_01110, partial [Gammaproteobacteria bacterium]|nr:hypothetical protein [Gammaproteobacteria bacterium]
LEKLIDINASGLVFMVCNKHHIRDMDKINLHKQWVKSKIIQQMEQDNVGAEALSAIMDEKVDLLQQMLENGEEISFQEEVTSAQPEDSTIQDEDIPIQEPEVEDKEPQPKKQKLNSGYKPQSKDMPTKLANERKPTKKVIMEDCVQLGLLTRKRAQYLITQMAGKQPAEAEKEIVIELRDNLHKQIRKLIRKDKKGPWSSPKAQEDLRVEIVQTPTVRSVVYLTREILQERDEWKHRARNSITGRIFGNRMIAGKDK